MDSLVWTPRPRGFPCVYNPARSRRAWLALALAATLIALVASPGPGAATTAGPDDTAGQPWTSVDGHTRLVVTYRDPLTRPAADEVRATRVASMGASDVLEVSTSDAETVATRLRADPSVAAVRQDIRVHAMLTPNDPLFALDWAMPRLGMPAAWDVTTGASVTVAVVDSGVNEIPDLAGRVLPGRDYVDGATPQGDVLGHGTSIAAIVAAKGNDGAGMAGICWSCRILPVKVIDSTGAGWSSDVASGITYAVDHGARVVNLSIGSTSRDPFVADAIAYALEQGVVVVAASGNDGSTTPVYPAAEPGVVSVGASDATDALYAWSGRGAWVDYAAPGDVETVSGTGDATHPQGTSFAAAEASGVIALLLSVRPSATFGDLVGFLDAGTTPVAGTSGGLLSASAAVRLAAGQPEPSSGPSPSPAASGSSGATSAPSSPTASPSPTPAPTPSPTPLPPGFSLSASGAGVSVQGSTIRFDSATSGVLGIQPHQNDPGLAVNSWLVTVEATRGWFHPDGLILGPAPLLYLQHLAGAAGIVVTLVAVRPDGSRAPSQRIVVAPR